MKLSIPFHDGATIESISLDPVESTAAAGVLLRHAGPRLSKAGVVVTPSTLGNKADTVVKLRPVDTATIDSGAPFGGFPRSRWM
ncbi:MAG: hypothetical protein IPP91_20315 [Betaproteobacteria bacterium]|nr:hypothetical protein [Betaproteobacteria bacterium]